MVWNKRTIVVKKETLLDFKTFEQTGEYKARQERATKVERLEAEYEIELDIDFDAIFSIMGEKAAKSRGGRAVDGFVTVKAKKKRELSRVIEPRPIPAHLVEVAS